MTRPFFARDRVTDFETFNRHAEVAVAQLRERFAEGEAVDFQASGTLFYLWLLDLPECRMHRISCLGLLWIRRPNSCSGLASTVCPRVPPTLTIHLAGHLQLNPIRAMTSLPPSARHSIRLRCEAVLPIRGPSANSGKTILRIQWKS